MDPKNRATILVVDDIPANLTLLMNVLKDSYRVLVANSGARALELAVSERPELILLDIMMPGMDGFEVCKYLKARPATQRIPVIFITARTDVVDETEGLRMGAVDFIHKPISPPILLARIHNHLQLLAWQRFLEDRQDWLEREVGRRIGQVVELQDATIQAMIALAEFRDEATGNHLRRTSAYVRCLAEELAIRGEASLTQETISYLEKAAPLHDIGKVAIPDHILLKTDKLSADEFALMKNHTVRGAEILLRIRHYTSDNNPMLIYASEIARHHHEHWDGTGYPDGLCNTEIPLSARLMAVADVYDALRSLRPYKQPLTHQQATQIIGEGRGSHFDPAIIDAFMARTGEFIRITDQYAD